MDHQYYIRQIVESDIDGLVKTFTPWHKTRAQFERYHHLHQLGNRVVLVAVIGDDIVGYVNLIWRTEYEHFRLAEIPEIVDLNVMTEHQHRGIGSALITACEVIARKHGKLVIGISVEQSPSYATANRLYPSLGYIPDGKGITEHDQELHLIKKIDPPISTPLHE